MTTAPTLIRLLPGGIPLREASPSEKDFFMLRPDVSGMATDDGAVVLNPYTKLNEDQLDAVALNEAARVIMSSNQELQPKFELTPEQRSAFKRYGPPSAIRATIAARLLSGDPTALTPTSDQIRFVARLAQAMGVEYSTKPIRGC